MVLSRIEVRQLKGLVEAIGVKPVDYMCRQDQTLLTIRVSLPIPICKNDISAKIAFVQGFNDEPGSIVMSFSHHVLN